MDSSSITGLVIDKLEYVMLLMLLYVPIVVYVWRIIPGSWELVSCLYECYEHSYFYTWSQLLLLLYGV